ncbi:hypothetical protein M8C21_019338 [Ambrosia artemisiifolia]|uniref:Uncharacterized protein n=1 Tax=Ambrosia artemisiifolia TaxID=4212 RepID=A0AAD5BQV4_AMBAR|nr:hypothetical protein M8C21_019338 [Ambrosia artemisiifolia]
MLSLRQSSESDWIQIGAIMGLLQQVVIRVRKDKRSEAKELGEKFSTKWLRFKICSRTLILSDGAIFLPPASGLQVSGGIFSGGLRFQSLSRQIRLPRLLLIMWLPRSVLADGKNGSHGEFGLARNDKVFNGKTIPIPHGRTSLQGIQRFATLITSFIHSYRGHGSSWHVEPAGLMAP